MDHPKNVKANWKVYFHTLLLAIIPGLAIGWLTLRLFFPANFLLLFLVFVTTAIALIAIATSTNSVQQPRKRFWL